MNRRVPWFPIALIVIGSLLLLDQFEILSIDWGIALWGLLGVFGAVKCVEGFKFKKPRRVFWGSMLLLFSIYKVLQAFYVIEGWSFLLFPSILIIIGCSLLARYLVDTKEWHILVASLLVGGIGTAVLISEYGYLDWWDVRWTIREYWPVALILFGLSLVMRGRFTHSRS